MIRIAIDGPGGAGKSSLAKAVAKELGIIYVDTGALYRTIGYYMVNRGIDPNDSEKVIAALPEFTLELTFIDGDQVILLNGENVKDAIRTPEMSMAASSVSAIKEVREYLLSTQQSIAKKNSVIMDGRDIGTVILPDAEIKIFLTASPEARAKRRYEELKAKGEEISYQQVYTEMAERDKNDSTRDIAPCKPAADAIMLDNSDMNPEQTVASVVKIINKFKKKNKTAYMKSHAILAPIIRFFSGIKVHGLENVPDNGGFMLCSNHIAARDVFLMGATCPRQIRFIAKKELFAIPLVGSVMRAWGAVKLDRGGNDVAAIRKSIELVDNGDLISIFPQGHRYPSVDPGKTPIKNGAGLVAYRSGCDIIPVFIKTKNNKYRIFRKIEIFYGKPIKNSELGFVNGGTEEYKAAAEIIFAESLKLGGYERISSNSNNKENDN